MHGVAQSGDRITMNRRRPSVTRLLAPSEWRIFAILALRHPLSVLQITEELNSQDPPHSVTKGTVRNLVSRMQDKGYLTATQNKELAATVYGPGVPYELALRAHVNGFLDQYATSGGPDLRLIREVVDKRLATSDPLSPLLDRIVVEVGRTMIRGTCVTVDSVLEQLASGSSIEEILAGHSELRREDIQAAVAFARAALTSPTAVEHH